ncbi:MAG: hypothetical protein HYX21_02080 [Candidatus Yanofskybacteria bacterium]|nr:hypothetical protein [Candidatus Yanofskybacteria bacterium]
MTKSIKVLMVILFGAAGLVVARVGILINKTFSPATAVVSESIKVDYQDSDDFDHDGLKNAEEAVWGSDPYNPDTDGDGYLDGEEAFSDHNPTQADNDSLAKTRRFLSMNSTERLASLVAGGVLSGDLKKSNNSQTYAQSVDSTASATVYSILSALEDVNVGDEVKNLVENTKEAQENYLNIAFRAISEDITEILLGQPKELVLLFSPDQTADSEEIYDDQQKERIKSKFLEHSVKFQQAYDEINNSSVSREWLGIHKKILTLLKKLELYYRSIALSTDDPLKQMVVLGNLQTVYLEAQPILLEINAKIKANNLTPPDSDFFDISILLTK